MIINPSLYRGIKHFEIMGLKGMIEKIEHQFDGSKSRSRKKYKKFRIKWLRRTPKTEIPNTRIRKGWEY